MQKLIDSTNNPDQLANEAECMYEIIEEGLKWKQAIFDGFHHTKTALSDRGPALPQTQKHQATVAIEWSPGLHTQRATQSSISTDTSNEMQVPEREMQKRRKLSETVPFKDAIRVAQLMDGTPSVAETDQFVRVRDAVVHKATEARTMAGRKFKCSPLHFDKVEMYIVFWARVFDKIGVHRLTTFMGLIRSVNESKVDPVGSRPISEATRSQPTLVQKVIDAYYLQSTTQISAITKNYVRYAHAADFYRQYRLLCSEAADVKTETGQLFQKLGLRTTVGRSSSTLVNDYLLHCLNGFGLNVDLDVNGPLHKMREQARTRMRNEIALSQSYYTISNVFGPGVWTMLPVQGFASCVIP